MHLATSALLPAAALCAVLSLSTAHASGLYVGGGIGNATIKDRASTPAGATFNESDTAYKLFGGYRFDLLPLVSLSAELGYRDLGTPDAATREYQADGFDYAALAGVGIGPMEAYLRLGGMRYDLDKIATGARDSFDGTAPVYGIGARFSLFGLGVRAEYERIDIDELDNADMVSVSVFYEF